MAEGLGSRQTFRASLRLLRTRRFGTFWVANLLSSIGTWAQQVAEPWLLLSLGSSPLVVGVDAFAMDAPVWVLTLLGGILADRADRRRVTLLFRSIQMMCPTLIVILLLAGAVRPWMIVALSLVVGVTDALSMPSFCLSFWSRCGFSHAAGGRRGSPARSIGNICSPAFARSRGHPTCAARSSPCSRPARRLAR
jgi:hypothetical protein